MFKTLLADSEGWVGQWCNFLTILVLRRDFVVVLEVGVGSEVLGVQRVSRRKLVHVDIVDLLEKIVLQQTFPSRVLPGLDKLEELQAVFGR